MPGPQDWQYVPGSSAQSRYGDITSGASSFANAFGVTIGPTAGSSRAGQVPLEAVDLSQAAVGNAQAKSITAQTAMRQKLLEMLLGGGGSSFFGASGGGSPSDASLYGLVDESGKGQTARINQSIKDQQGSVFAALQNRGWSGSNLLPASMASLEQERGSLLGDLQSSLASQKIGIGERSLDRALQQKSLLSNLFAQLLG